MAQQGSQSGRSKAWESFPSAVRARHLSHPQPRGQQPGLPCRAKGTGWLCLALARAPLSLSPPLQKDGRRAWLLSRPFVLEHISNLHLCQAPVTAFLATHGCLRPIAFGGRGREASRRYGAGMPGRGCVHSPVPGLSVCLFCSKCLLLQSNQYNQSNHINH